MNKKQLKTALLMHYLRGLALEQVYLRLHGMHQILITEDMADLNNLSEIEDGDLFAACLTLIEQETGIEPWELRSLFEAAT